VNDLGWRSTDQQNVILNLPAKALNILGHVQRAYTDEPGLLRRRGRKILNFLLLTVSLQKKEREKDG